jgi:hypothetical protein
MLLNDGGAGRSRTDLHGFAIRCITALLPRRYDKKGKLMLPFSFGAGDESRTRDLNLGKVALYQLSYSRVEKEIITHFFTPLQATLKILGWPAFSA